MTTFWSEHAVLPDGGTQAGVVTRVERGAFTEVTAGVRTAPAGAEVLTGLTVPGFGNAHSHAFHRALRGWPTNTDGVGSFWTWRTAMYDVAAALGPASCFDLARAVFAEMVLAGVTAVGEFHYVHHRPDGSRYVDPNELGLAVVAAARAAGLRITLLDTCYLRGDATTPLHGAQIRFGDGSAGGWADRVDALAATGLGDGVLVGAAAHSVRALAASDLAAVADWARRHEVPLHVHLSEQPAENEACAAEHGVTPTGLLHRAGVLGPRTTAVHATHLTAGDVDLLGAGRTGVCLCPTTERDLADGIAPAAELAAAGSPLSVGSDSQAVVDPFEEVRGVETHERLRSGRRGTFSATALLTAGTRAAHTAIGWDGGRIAVGARADLVAVDLGSTRTAGGEADGATVVWAATAADVTDVVVDGRVVVRDRVHVTVPDVPAALASAIRAVRP